MKNTVMITEMKIIAVLIALISLFHVNVQAETEDDEKKNKKEETTKITLKQEIKIYKDVLQQLNAESNSVHVILMNEHNEIVMKAEVPYIDVITEDATIADIMKDSELIVEGYNTFIYKRF